MSTSHPRVRRTLTLSILDGVFYSVMVGAGETYFIPYAIVLGASNLILGLLVAFPILVGSLSQIFSERLLALVGSRKRLVGITVGIQALTFLPMLLIGHLDSAAKAELFLIVVCAYWALGLVAGPSWSSLMGDLVPEAERGDYFGRRSRYVQIATFASLVSAGLVLFLFRQSGDTLLGFAVVFLVAAAARLVSMAFLLSHWEPPMDSPPTGRTLSAIVETFREPRQRLLIRYLTWMNFAVYLSGPFFAAYMLRAPERQGLAWSYGTYTAVNGVAVLAKFLFLPLWGKASDRFGSRKCLVLAAWLLCALPLPWLFPAENMTLFLTIIILSQVWSGFAWAGHELCSFNFLLDSAPPAERPRLVASMNTVNGMMVFLGSSMGAVLVISAPSGVNPFLLVFLASSLVRFGVCGTLVHRLKEVRVVERISYSSLLFRVVAIRPQMGAIVRFFALPNRRPNGRPDAGPGQGAPA